MGWWSEVKEAFQTAFAIAIEHNQTELIARIQLNLGWYFDAIGQPTEALRYFQRAEKLFTDLNISVDVATTQLFEGHLLQRIGSLRSAIRHYNDALTQFANAGLNPMIGQAQVYMAAARRRRGQKRDFIKASELLDKAEVVWGEQKNQTWLLKVILERISIELDRNNAKSAKLLFEKLPVQSEQQYFVAEFYLLRAETLRLESGEKAYCQEVEKAYEIALDYAHKQNNLWLQRHIYVGLGRLFFDNNVAKAEQMLEEAAAIDARIRRTLSVAELKAGFHQQTNDVFSLLILLALEHGNATQVLHQTWRAKSEPFLDLLWTKKIEDSASYKEINELVWVREQLATLRYRRAMDSIDNQEYVPDSTREAEDPEIQRLTERILELRLHMNQPQNLDDEQWYNLSPETSLSMDEDILLEYVLCGEEIIGIYTNRTGQRAAMKVANEDDLLDLLDSFRFNLHHALSRPTTQQQLLLPECKEILGELYQILIAPLLNSVPFQSGNRRLLIAPCDPITLLPFSALWDGKEYLCQQWRIEMIQSGALLTLPQENEGARGESVIIASTANGKILQTAHEAKKIATLLPDSELFIDKPGTLMQLTQFTSAPKFLHIAGHTIPNNDAPIMWAFQLTDEVLSVEQSYELPLEGTELVTLSGCTTASGLENGGALLAFQSAFFVAGARRVLSSLWPIQDDTSISLWMEHFYRLLALDVTAPDALQLTQIHFLSDPFYSHPAMWAAFVCARR